MAPEGSALFRAEDCYTPSAHNVNELHELYALYNSLISLLDQSNIAVEEEVRRTAVQRMDESRKHVSHGGGGLDARRPYLPEGHAPPCPRVPHASIESCRPHGMECKPHETVVTALGVCMYTSTTQSLHFGMQLLKTCFILDRVHARAIQLIAKSRPIHWRLDNSLRSHCRLVNSVRLHWRFENSLRRSRNIRWSASATNGIVDAARNGRCIHLRSAGNIDLGPGEVHNGFSWRVAGTHEV